MPKRRKSTVKIQNGNAKKNQRTNVSGEIDMISNFPDSILAHIIGKLPTKYAIGTIVLSTRWKHLFTQIPNPEISINDYERRNLDPDEDYELSYYRRKTNFIKFMYKLFDVTLHDVPRIHKFHLDCHIDYEFEIEDEMTGMFADNEHISTWIASALKLNVSYLWVFCPNSYGCGPESLFCCNSLVEIMLNWHAGLIVPGPVCLPNLKCLYLKNVSFHGDDLSTVLSGCNVLEELCLCNCGFNETKNGVRIFTPTVKRFKWMDCFKEEKHGLELDMPALNFFCFDDNIPKYFLVKNLNSLRKAHINCGPTLEECQRLTQEDLWCRLKFLADLVVGCSNVEFLFLSYSSAEAISFSFPMLCPFYNLIELELFHIGINGWKLLPYLLKNAPNLEALVFTEGFSDREGCYNVFVHHMTEYSGKLASALNLQRIRFEKFYGEIDEMCLVKYFLKHAKGLRKIEISFSKLCPEKLSKATTEVVALLKRSKKCNLDLIFGEEDKYDVSHSFGMRKFE